MFTGIIEAKATIVEKKPTGLVLSLPPHFTDLKLGSSVAVSGVCLSVIRLSESEMEFEVVPTTWRKTKLGSVQKGDSVNVERAMRADSRFEGHIVTGHVEATAEVMSHTDGVLTICVPSNLTAFIVHHGSITIDGVSLTVADLQKANVSVALIPLTRSETTLGALEKGDTVNVETDILAKYVHSS